MKTVDEIVKNMTRDEKIALIAGKNFWQMEGVPSAGLKPVMLTDGPHGLRKQAAAADHLGLPQRRFPAQICPAQQPVGFYGGTGVQKPRRVHPSQTRAGQASGPQRGLHSPDGQHEILGHRPGLEQGAVYVQRLPAVPGLRPCPPAAGRPVSVLSYL